MKLHCVLFSVGFALTAEFSAAADPSEVPADGDPYPIVLTPTRLRQSLQDVPASVTIITADMLRKFAIRSIPEALRLVPGMAITQASGLSQQDQLPRDERACPSTHERAN